jgi:hypothetical protein
MVSSRSSIKSTDVMSIITVIHWRKLNILYFICFFRVMVMIFNATFNSISVQLPVQSVPISTKCVGFCDPNDWLADLVRNYAAKLFPNRIQCILGIIMSSESYDSTYKTYRKTKILFSISCLTQYLNEHIKLIISSVKCAKRPL